MFVARAVSDALGRQGCSKEELWFVGSERGQERELLADTGISLTLLPGRGIQRSLRPRALLANLGAIVGIVAATVRSFWFVGRRRPRAVVSVGGYAAAPVGLAALVLGRPLILVNIDAVPGLTHRLLGRFATASCVAFAETGLRHEVVTGAPVRSEFVSLDRSVASRRAAREALGCDPDVPFVAVVTGSLGARSVNRAVSGLADTWRDRSGTIFHVTGRRDFSEINASAAAVGHGRLDYRVVDFENRMPLLYQAADVAITRAGALTVSELANTGVAGIMVPLPGAPGDHQTKNARSLVEKGAGVMIADSELTSEGLSEVLSQLLASSDQRGAIEKAARDLAHPRAADEVASEVLAHVR